MTASTTSPSSGDSERRERTWSQSARCVVRAYDEERRGGVGRAARAGKAERLERRCAEVPLEKVDGSAPARRVILERRERGRLGPRRREDGDERLGEGPVGGKHDELAGQPAEQPLREGRALGQRHDGEVARRQVERRDRGAIPVATSRPPSRSGGARRGAPGPRSSRA